MAASTEPKTGITPSSPGFINVKGTPASANKPSNPHKNELTVGVIFTCFSCRTHPHCNVNYHYPKGRADFVHTKNPEKFGVL
ncbi:MAG: hypothetical protein BACC_04480 [Bacteroides sp.]